jgi:hypothetical protein
VKKKMKYFERTKVFSDFGVSNRSPILFDDLCISLHLILCDDMVLYSYANSHYIITMAQEHILLIVRV